MSETFRNQAIPDEMAKRARRVRRARIGYALIVLIYAMAFAFWQAEAVPLEVHAASVVLWAICLLPLARWYSRGYAGLPMFELICFAYGLQYSLPIYLEPNVVKTTQSLLPLRWTGMLETLIITLLGVSALIAGYYLVQHWRLIQVAPRIDLPLRPERRPIYLALAFGLSVVVLYAQVASEPQTGDAFNSIVGVVINQFRLAIVLLAYLVYGAPRSHRLLKLILYAFVLVGVVLGLVTGLLENALIPLVLLFLVQWHATRKLPALLLVAGFVMFIVLNAVKSDYRSVAWYGGQDLDPSQRLSLWLNLGQNVVQDMTTGDTAGNLENLIRSSMARFDLAHKFVYVHEMTPRFIPYYNGDTYSYLLISWIPRFLWPDKPSASIINNRLDVDYGLLYESQTLTTTIAIGQLPEAYVNYGILGVIFIMLLQGLVIGMINHIYNGPDSDGGRAIYLSLMVFFLNGIGSSTVIWFGALWQNLLANTLILRLFAFGFHAPQRAEDETTLSTSPPLHTALGQTGER